MSGKHILNSDMRPDFTHLEHSTLSLSPGGLVSAFTQYRSDSLKPGNPFPQLVWASIFLAFLCTMLLINAAQVYAQPGEHGHPSDDHHGASAIAGGWEGSAQAVAYSEYNHHLAGLFVLLMGCAELSLSLSQPSLRWAKLLLPTAMLLASIMLLVWSDHEAWPIGSMSFAQTFFGHDTEIIQHKIYGLLLFLVGLIEALRRVGHIPDGVWSVPLPVFAIIGGLMLFGHSHGFHPAAEKIARHHFMIGMTASTAGSFKLLSGWFRSPSHVRSSTWQWLWAGLILLIGMQLLMYSE
jgi:putative copper resistance protein D